MCVLKKPACLNYLFPKSKDKTIRWDPTPMFLPSGTEY